MHETSLALLAPDVDLDEARVRFDVERRRRRVGRRRALLASSAALVAVGVASVALVVVDRPATVDTVAPPPTPTEVAFERLGASRTPGRGGGVEAITDSATLEARWVSYGLAGSAPTPHLASRIVVFVTLDSEVGCGSRADRATLDGDVVTITFVADRSTGCEAIDAITTYALRFVRADLPASVRFVAAGSGSTSVAAGQVRYREIALGDSQAPLGTLAAATDPGGLPALWSTLGLPDERPGALREDEVALGAVVVAPCTGGLVLDDVVLADGDLRLLVTRHHGRTCAGVPVAVVVAVPREDLPATFTLDLPADLPSSDERQLEVDLSVPLVSRVLAQGPSRPQPSSPVLIGDAREYGEAASQLWLPALPAVDFTRDVVLVFAVEGFGPCAPTLPPLRIGGDEIEIGEERQQACFDDYQPYAFAVAVDRSAIGSSVVVRNGGARTYLAVPPVAATTVLLSQPTSPGVPLLAATDLAGLQSMWSAAGLAGEPLDVDFSDRVVVAVTTEPGCAQPFDRFDIDGRTWTARFANAPVGPAQPSCPPSVVTFLVSIDRDAVASGFTLRSGDQELEVAVP